MLPNSSHLNIYELIIKVIPFTSKVQFPSSLGEDLFSLSRKFCISLIEVEMSFWNSSEI
jgi:hypothetical protein